MIRFDASGRLLSIADTLASEAGQGIRMDFLRDGRSRRERVCDTLGQEIEFEFPTDGRLTRIRKFDYAYDADGRLEPEIKLAEKTLGASFAVLIPPDAPSWPPPKWSLASPS